MYSALAAPQSWRLGCGVGGVGGDLNDEANDAERYVTSDGWRRIQQNGDNEDVACRDGRNDAVKHLSLKY